MDAKCSQDLLELPTEFPSSGKGWLSEKITNPSLRPLMKKMEDDLKNEKLTMAMIVKEFMMQRLAPLQAHSRPIWELMGDDDKLRLCSGMLPSTDLDLTSSILLEMMPADLPVAHLPLYRRPDKAEQLEAVSGYVEVAAPAPATVDVSSGGEEESKDEEKTLRRPSRTWT